MKKGSVQLAAEIKRNNRILILLGVVLALAAGGLTLFLLSNGSSSNNAPATQNIVVAKDDIAQGTSLTPSLVILAPVGGSIPADALRDPNAVNGRVLQVQVSKGTPITQSFLAAGSANASGQANSGATNPATIATAGLSISKGDVALAIPAAGTGGPYTGELQSVGYFIQPEDHIDILYDPGNSSVHYAFQNVRVLKVGNASSQSAGGAAATPTIYIVELPRDQAEQLAYLVTNKGSASIVKYVLRPHAEYTQGYENATGNPIPPTTDNGATAGSFNQAFNH